MTRPLIIILLCLLAGYGIFEARPLIIGPTISLASPADDAVATSGVVTVSGTALRAATLTLDGATLLHEENGDFSSMLALPHGTSLLTLAATDRFGRRVTATRTVFVP